MYECMYVQAIRRFSELSCHVSQLGLDEQSIHSSGGTRYSILRHEEGEAIAASNDILSARYYLRRGRLAQDWHTLDIFTTTTTTTTNTTTTTTTTPPPPTTTTTTTTTKMKVGSFYCTYHIKEMRAL